MVIRPVDKDGDILPVESIDKMAKGKQAVASVINLRLNFYKGEWWEDETIGFSVPDFLVNGVRENGIGLLAKYISSYISDTKDVREVIDVQSTMNNHNLTFYCTVLTIYGETETVEVNIDGVF